MPEFIVDLFVDKDEAEHGSAQAPLIVALLEQHELKQSGQQLGQQLWPLLHMGSNCLQVGKRVVFQQLAGSINSRAKRGRHES